MEDFNQQNTKAGQQHDRQGSSQENRREHYGNNAMSVTTSIRLWHYLFKDEKNGRQQDKMTKAQAFYDLLAKQQLAEVTEDPDWIDRGFVQLAQEWGWSRETVSKFINRLVAEKAARTFSYAGKTIVILTNITGLKTGTIKKVIEEKGHRAEKTEQSVRITPGTASTTPRAADASLNLSEV